MEPLLYRGEQKDDECLLSYLIRMSEFNGFLHLGKLLNYAGLDWKNNRAPVHKILTGEFDLRILFANLALEEPINNTQSLYETFEKTVDNHQVFVRTPKVCPRCLIEDGYAHAIWSFLPIVCCSKHELMLVDTDISTGSRLSWYRQSLQRFNPANINIIAQEIPAPKALLKHTRFVESLILNCKKPAPIPAVLSDLDFRETLTFMHFLMHYQCRLNGVRFIPHSDSNIELAHKYQFVWGLINDWPNSFYSMLSQYMESPMSSKGKTGLNKHFRDLYEKLNRQKKNKGIQKIRVEFARYIQRYWPEVIEVDRVTRLKLDKNLINVISKKEACRILGCRGPKLDSYVHQGKLTISIFNGKAHYCKKEVNKLSELISSNWSMKQFCDNLEITRYQAKQVLDAGIFTVIQSPDEFNRDWLINKSKTVKLMKKLLAQSTNLSDSTSKKYSRQGIQKAGYSFPKLVKGMLNKNIKYSVHTMHTSPLSFRQFNQFTFCC